MNERNITQICLIITLIGIIFFILNYEEEYTEKTISEMTEKIGSKGIIIGKVDYVIKEEPLIFILQNEEKIKVFYPKKIEIKKDDIVEIFAETTEYNKEIELFAQKVIIK
ncbi:MAG: hypothetical protein PHP82_02975 [Candidatus ainarchaeum sp.]|nr:hypothetical protein [Candidatus ainarchaeum sp.]